MEITKETVEHLEWLCGVADVLIDYDFDGWSEIGVDELIYAAVKARALLRRDIGFDFELGCSAEKLSYRDWLIENVGSDELRESGGYAAYKKEMEENYGSCSRGQ